MYEKITGENPFEMPMRIFPAPHYTMGGLWVDYNLMSTIPGLFVAGEANFSDHGANRLGASALMQGLADGYFIVPYSVGNYIASNSLSAIQDNNDSARSAVENTKAQISRIMNIKGSRTVDSIHKELGRVMWDYCGMSRSEQGLKKALEEIPKIRNAFWNDTYIPGTENYVNTELEKAGRVADFIDLAELMCTDALERKESCGGHFREEYQTADNEAKRDDQNFCHVTAWEYTAEGKKAIEHREKLTFDNVKLATRSYK